MLVKIMKRLRNMRDELVSRMKLLGNETGEEGTKLSRNEERDNEPWASSRIEMPENEAEQL